MDEKDKQISEMQFALGLALGALKAVVITKGDVNFDGLKDVINRIEATVHRDAP